MSEDKPDPDQPDDLPELDAELTVIIDESEFQALGEPTEAIDAEVEEVLVVLPDDEDLDDVPLLSHHPDVEVTEQIPDFTTVAAVAEETEVSEALPDIEHVDDITALLQDEAVELEAPSDPRAVRYEDDVPRRRFPWIPLAAAACLAGAAVLYGPGLLEKPTDPAGVTPVARAQNRPDTAPVSPDGPALVDSGPDLEAERQQLRVWISGALERNLGASAKTNHEESSVGESALDSPSTDAVDASAGQEQR